MLQAFGLSFSPGPRVGPLFDNVDISLDAGEKVALVGRNGAGKSVLLRMLAGRLAPSRGRVTLARGASIAYLDQDFDLLFAGTLRELLERDASDIPEYAIARAMHRLGLAAARLDQTFSTLSHGERMRGALAALLAREPDVLLLDEPTNHLDVEARAWLQTFLRDCHETVLMACHDRSVINAVVDRVIELENGRVTQYTGTFDDLVSQKQDRNARHWAEYERSRAEDRRLRIAAEEAKQNAAKMTRRPTQRTFDPYHKSFYAGKRAGIERRAKAILKRVEHCRADAPEKPVVEDELQLSFPSRPLRSSVALTVRGLRKAYGRELFGGLNITLERGSRVAVAGPNGAGKTTLFRILLGEERADDGEVLWAPDARVATLAQAREALDAALPAIAALRPASMVAETFARCALGRLGLRGNAADRPVSVLSVGERTKVEIISMLLTEANVLILDEPTNHLDITSMEALESALLDFPGAILLASHDRTFVDRVATEVVTLG
jgi:ATPase subunit of ABC transporter with duplicated ATPase domains